MPFRIMPFLLLVVPIVEIAVFIVVGQQIGVGLTILLIIATAIIGAMQFRRQGFSVMSRIREDVNAGRVPAAAMAHGVFIIVAGVLLLTPGFVTDAIGFTLFVPAVREWAWRTVAPGFFANLSGSWSRWPGTGEEGRPYDSTIELSVGDTPPQSGPDDGDAR